MYITVKLLNGFKKELIYKVPVSWDMHNLVGAIVHVPLQKRVEVALIMSVLPELKIQPAYAIRELQEQEHAVIQVTYAQFIKRVADYYNYDVLYFYRRIRKFLRQAPEAEDYDRLYQANTQVDSANNIILTAEQQHIVDTMTPHIINPSYQPALLHGVTGSGKTEVYKKLIKNAYEHNKSTLFLVPEVSLAVQFIKLFREQLADIPHIYGFHSATSTQEKKNLWQILSEKRPAIILGVHLPILLPLDNVGLIIIDEEHDSGFQEKKYPKINSKEVALLRAQAYRIPIIMGSATPSIAALHTVYTKKWHFFSIQQRFSGAFPTVSIAPLITKKERKHFWITQELEHALAQQLLKKEQSIIFLNRRGYSFFLQCIACGHIVTCNFCSVSLTVHNNNMLKCHYCAFQKELLTECEKCSASKKYLLKKGIGTQQIVTILEKMFPAARIARADADTTINKKKWSLLIHDFYTGNYDILVGTQTITKGYHFPQVTLVGIIWADIQLGFPFYNATETTIQQIIQVAGRAGRQSAESSVIVQIMSDNPVFNYIREKEYTSFYNYEINYRALLKYPPCTRLAEIELRHENQHILDDEAILLVQKLEYIKITNNYAVIILGPAQPPVNKIKNCFIKKIYLKSDNIQDLLLLYNTVLKQITLNIALFFTPNPLQ